MTDWAAITRTLTDPNAARQSISDTITVAEMEPQFEENDNGQPSPA